MSSENEIFGHGLTVDMYMEVPSSNPAPMSDVLNDAYCGVPRSQRKILCHLQRLYDVINPLVFTEGNSTAEVRLRNGYRTLDNLMTLIKAQRSYTTE